MACHWKQIYANMTTSHKMCATTTLENLKWQIEPPTPSTYMYILMNHWIATKRLAVIVSKIFKRVVSHIMYTSCTLFGLMTTRFNKCYYYYNICSRCSLQHECKHVDASAMSPTTRSINSVIQTVHSFLMLYLSSSTSEILVRAGGGHFEHEV